MLSGIDVERVRVVVFDLDGTLYENIDQYDYYISCLASRLPETTRQEFLADCAAARAGTHALRYGLTYDRTRRLLVQTDGSRPVGVWKWDGTSVDPQAYYSTDEIVGHCLPDFITASDPWWLPHACASHHGLSIWESEAAYKETRDHMMQESYRYRGTQGLSGAMRENCLRYTHVLATNSACSEGERILCDLDVAGLFDLEIYRAQKPHGTQNVIRRVCERFKTTPDRVLSIGDNPYNEILPARTMGCQAILVDPCRCYAGSHLFEHRVESLAEVFPTLLQRPPVRDAVPASRLVEELD